MSLSAVVWLLVPRLLLQGQPVDTIDASQVCTHSRGFVGPCITVHGRLSRFSDNAPLQIWPVGTSRLLGVQTADSPFYLPVACRVPAELDHTVDLETAIYADFVLRPLTPPRPGVMQRVCIAQARRVRVVHHTSIRSR